MQDIIRLLPDALANQIAAGEVVQRPASAVKELLENAIDAGASHVQLVVKDSGKTLIQVTDDGAGMSEMDARHCFDRHATSKIAAVEDLFNIHTFGFRGEALASIAAVAQVELKTKRSIDEVGTKVSIEGSNIELQEPVMCPKGTTIAVKNLFFNVPARRNFLKSNPVELKYIVEEFQRVALCNPEVEMTMIHNDSETLHLPTGNLAKRIVSIFGKQYQEKLLLCEEAIQDMKVWGYVGKPETSKKTRGEQLFFANGRFIKHSYLHHAIMNAYEGLLPDGHFPFYLLNIDIDPAHIDINVHPTKTEVKFEDERTLYAVVRAATKKALAHHGSGAGIDFDFNVNFAGTTPAQQKASSSRMETPSRGNAAPPTAFAGNDNTRQRSNLRNWEKLFDTPQPREENKEQSSAWNFPTSLDEVPELESNNPSNAPTSTENSPQGMVFSSAANREEQDFPVEDKASSSVMQIRNRYILSQVKSGLMVIDQEAAMERILYERFVKRMANSQQGVSQQLLFPRTVNLSPADFALLEELKEEVQALGLMFDIFGKSAVIVNGLPAEAENLDEQELLENFLEQVKRQQTGLSMNPRENTARVMAQRLCHRQIKSLSPMEMRGVIEQLFACSNPNYSPSGQLIISMVDMEQLEGLFS